MNKQRGYLFTWLWAIAILALVLPCTVADAGGRGDDQGNKYVHDDDHGKKHGDRDDDDGPRSRSPLMQIMPDDGVVMFQQVQWDLDLVQVRNSSWGQVAVHPDRLMRLMDKRNHPPDPIRSPHPNHPLGHDKPGQSGNVPANPVHPLSKGEHKLDTTGSPLGKRFRDRSTEDNVVYLQVFLYAPGSNAPIWSIANMSIVPPVCGKDDSGRAFHQPACKYLNLAPYMPMGQSPGPMRGVKAAVLVSAQPLPTIRQMLPAVQKFESMRFPVGRTVENAEGMLPDQLLNTFPPSPREINRILPLGPPPSPIIPTAVPVPELDLVAPICVMQTDAPNIECAHNQCVPMAQTNTIQYLEDRYNGGIWAWTLPHLPIPGIGRINSAGDVVYWEPFPVYSLTANVDFFTRRNGVYDFETGSGSNICQLFRGLFGYLELAEPYTNASFRHQGTNAPLIGDGYTCDTSTILLGGRVSVREGENPTWEWIYDQLSKGRGVAICFGRYDSSGNRTSGHCIRVWGACQFGSQKYIYTLDDGNQGANNVGTRTQVWNVADTGGPGDNPGTPDGRMNMDGMSWEIEFANSIQVHPSFIFPIITFPG